MIYQEWGRLKFWGVLVAVFLAGGVLSSSLTVENGSREASANTQAIRELDTIDRQIFSVSGEIIDAQMTALETAGTLLGRYPSISAGDFEAGTDIVNQQTERIEQANRTLESLQVQRAQIVE